MFEIKLRRSTFVALPKDRPLNWNSHMMAPAPVSLVENGVTEIFVGGWDSHGISSIYSFMFDLESLSYIPNSSVLRLEKGTSGTFDENGVFPASIIQLEESWVLSYTGFQLGHQIPHYNFGGIAVKSPAGLKLKRLSQAPVIDRSDEGLTVRAGLSAIEVVRTGQKTWLSVYAAGSSFEFVNGKMRPNYSVYSQSRHPLQLKDTGQLKVSYNEIEHGVGRPYLSSYKELILLFYTRRRKDFNYLPGLAISDDYGDTFTRFDQILENVTPRIEGQDNEMQYFPAPLIWNEKLYIFYNGNNFGRYGMGVWEFQLP